MKQILEKFSVRFLSFILAFVVFMGVAIVRSIAQPPVGPPRGNPEPPLNTGVDPQTKKGSLTIQEDLNARNVYADVRSAAIEFQGDDLILNTPNGPLQVRAVLTNPRHYHLEISSNAEKCEFLEGIGENKNCSGNTTTVMAPFLQRLTRSFALVERAFAVQPPNPGIRPPTGASAIPKTISIDPLAYAFCTDQDGCTINLTRRYRDSGVDRIHSKGPNRLFVSADNRWIVAVDQGDDPSTGNDGFDGGGGKEDILSLPACDISDAETGTNDAQAGFGLRIRDAGVCVLDIWD